MASSGDKEALNLPWPGDYIAFPFVQEKTITVLWSEQNRAMRAEYYVDKCWFGSPKNTSTTDIRVEGINPRGETIIFIAKDLAEERMVGAPHIDHVHVRSAPIVSGTPNPTRAGVTWAYFQLDSRFHYGQNSTKNPKVRWIVYHPSVIPGVPTPRQFQHRFLSNTWTESANVAIQLTSAAAGVFSEGLSEPTKGIVSFLKSLIEKQAGHNLRQFADPDKAKTQSRINETAKILATLTPLLDDLNHTMLDGSFAKTQDRVIYNTLAPLLPVACNTVDENGKIIENTFDQAIQETEEELEIPEEGVSKAVADRILTFMAKNNKLSSIDPSSVKPATEFSSGGINTVHLSQSTHPVQTGLNQLPEHPLQGLGTANALHALPNNNTSR